MLISSTGDSVSPRTPWIRVVLLIHRRFISQKNIDETSVSPFFSATWHFAFLTPVPVQSGPRSPVPGLRSPVSEAVMLADFQMTWCSRARGLSLDPARSQTEEGKRRGHERGHSPVTSERRSVIRRLFSPVDVTVMFISLLFEWDI